MNNQRLYDRLFEIKNEDEFNMLALEIFHYQYQKTTIYRTFVDLLKTPQPRHYTEIPFLSISFFKTHHIIAQDKTVDIIFRSSGTTGQQRSTHFVADRTIYIRSFEKTYREQIGDPKNQVILALLPNYIEQGESSLVFMVDQLIKQSNSHLSGFLLDNIDQIQHYYQQALSEKKEVVIFGVSYALLDLAQRNVAFSQAKIIETGGMKGRRKELTKEHLHQILKDGFHVDHIFSEYGMTELLSQAYSTENTWFKTPAWMKILVRDVNDYAAEVQEGQNGRMNVIDLANINSCSFIETEDIGRKKGNLFQVLGRIDRADIRGCNLLYT